MSTCTPDRRLIVSIAAAAISICAPWSSRAGADDSPEAVQADYASAAALLYVACVMAQGLAEIAWDDITEYGPAVVAAVSMPFTYSIATGIGLGFITYALVKLVSGKFADAGPAVLLLAAIFAVKFWIG